MSAATIRWIERAISAALIATALFIGWHIMRTAEDGIRADERAKWARAQCSKLAGPRMREWTLTQSDTNEVFLRCKFDPRGL
jgi:hypothetical protein